MFNIPIELQSVIIYVFDLTPLFLYFIFFKISIKDKNHLNSMGVLLVPIFFSFILIIVTLINLGSLTSVVTRLGAIFRFIPLALLLHSLKVSYKIKITDFFINSLLVLFIIQILIGFLEAFYGESMMSFFLPQTINQLSTSKRVIELGSIFGTFPNTVEYTYMMVISFAIMITFKKFKLISFFTLATLYLVFKSGSTTGFGLFLYFLFLNIDKKYKRKLLMLAVLTSIIFLYTFYSQLESDIVNLYDGLYNSRLGILIFTLPQTLTSSCSNAFFGFGADQNIVYNTIMQHSIVPLIFSSDGSVNALDDIYWVSTIVYSGFLGLMLLMYFFYRVFKIFINADYISLYPIKNLIIFIFAIVIFGSFFNQIIHIRPFSFLFWSILGILNIFEFSQKEVKNENPIN